MPDRGLWLGCGLGRPVVLVPWDVTAVAAPPPPPRGGRGGFVGLFPPLAIWVSNSGFIKGWAQGKLTGCKQDLPINLPGCFRLLFLLSFIRKTKNAWLKNPTDLLYKHLMKPLLTKKDGNLPILSGNDVV